MPPTLDKKLAQLNEEQRKVHDAVVNNRSNVFFTGAAGTGKSFVLQCIVESLMKNGKAKDEIAVTASTGTAAFRVEGITVHSFAGIGIGDLTAEEYYMKMSNNRLLKKRWNKTSVLIIDEISMIDSNVFDILESLARKVKRKSSPFGGIQIIVVGDFMQLSPVSTEFNPKKFAFESDAWDKCIKDENYYCLRKVQRQSDEKFISVLRAIRVGVVNDGVREFMEEASVPKEYPDDAKVTYLYSKKVPAKEHNARELHKLPGTIIEFNAIDTFTISKKQLEQCQAPEILHLKKGALVMLVKNLSKILVNGTVGEVVDIIVATSGKSIFDNGVEIDSTSIDTKDLVPIVNFKMLKRGIYTTPIARQEFKTQTQEGKIVCSRTQLPLTLAWATTIHKSQGQTIQRLKVDLSNIFEHGQVYTALSRAVGPAGLEVTGFEEESVSASDVAGQFCLKHKLL